MIKEIFNHVPIHQGPILALIYPRYTNTENNKGKEKKKS